MQVMVPPEKTDELEHVGPKLTVAVGAAAASF